MESARSGKAPSDVATIKDVAARAGVSVATVSRVLSGKEGVRKALAERVHAAVLALDYHPNQSARRLRERKSRIIGVLVPDIQIPFFASIVVSIDKVLQDAGYLLLLGNTNETLAGEQAHLNIFLSEVVSGVIFAAADARDMSNYRRLQELGIPLVAIDRAPGDLEVDTVQLNNVHAAWQAVSHLIEEGHTRIAWIGGSPTASTSVERLQGYEQAMQSAGLPIDPSWVQPGWFTHEGGYRSMEAIMHLPERPTSVVIANQVMTLGALQFIHEHGYEIPSDIAMIGFDDMAWASALRPALTVVVQPVNDIGTLAGRLMLDRVRDPESSIKHVTLKARLIVRASCNCGREGVKPPVNPHPHRSSI